MADNSGWYYTEEGSIFHVDNEGHINYIGETCSSPDEGTSPTFGGTMAADTVLADTMLADVPADTVPAVISQNYQPYDQGPNSWPGIALPGYEHQKHAGHNEPHFGGGSQQSCYAVVDYPAANHDVYRDAKNKWGCAGPPDSKYNKDYEKYKKKAQAEANEADDAYKKHANTARRHASGDVKQDSDTLGGKPVETQAWHNEAATLADAAAQACQR
ncbi:hypothetical protein CEP51_004240 [Fusarium floridanum]|uniref:Uncharacterized protein n=1 Tax=Fusarium floridanum TaxID=1325733 RepID=A0A428S296_9HYPO|nr:hypothetical protein CEP51_004240 [Fusarium floridanum]